MCCYYLKLEFYNRRARKFTSYFPSYKKKRQYKYARRGENNFKGKTLSLVNRGPAFAPDRLFTKLRWADDYSFTLTSGRKSYSWRGNSIYDPDAVVGIGQFSALGANQYKEIFNFYKVHASNINIRVINQSGTAGKNLNAVVYPAAIASNATDDPKAQDAMCKPGAKYRVISLAGGGPIIPIKHFASSKRILGVKDLTDETFGAALNSSDPATVWYWNLVVDDILNNSSSDTFKIVVEITYFVELYNRGTDIHLT